MNVKMFVYFTDVKPAAGPLTYAPRTHPLGSRRELPEHDEQGRSDDAQLAQVVPESEWVLCEGPRATVVFADTCGYHKQLKPESGERLLAVSHYVSGTPLVPRVARAERRRRGLADGRPVRRRPRSTALAHVLRLRPRARVGDHRAARCTPGRS